MRLLEYFLYLIIFLIPTYLIRFSIFSIPINALEVLVSVLFFIWLTINLKSQISNLKTTIQNSKIFTTGVALLFIGLLLGVIISDSTRTSLGVIKSLFVAPFLFFLVARDVLNTEEKKEKTLWALAFSGIGVATIALGYWLFGRLTFDGRLAAFYESPNMLAMYIVPALFVMARELSSKFKIQNSKLRFKVLSFLLLLFILFLTRSLGAIIAVFVASLAHYLYTAFLNGRRKMQYTLFFIIVFAGIALPFFSLFLNPWAMGRNSIASRAMVWRASIDMVKHNWLFGIGPGMFQEMYLAQQKKYPPYLEWAVPHPHNIFLTIWLYAGLTGFVGFLLILFWFFSQKQPFILLIPREWWNISLFLILLYFLIHGAIDNTLWRPDMAMIWWLILTAV